jgi:ribosomal protein S7
MLFTFKSATNADLIMHEKSGKEILALLGKSPDDARGIIAVEQLTAAIATLQTAMAVDKARQQETATSLSKTETDDEPPVSLAQRAAPFIDMLKRAVKAGEPVVWGV